MRTVRRDVDRVRVLRQPAADESGDVFIIFDEQHAHRMKRTPSVISSSVHRRPRTMRRRRLQMKKSLAVAVTLIAIFVMTAFAANQPSQKDLQKEAKISMAKARS